MPRAPRSPLSLLCALLCALVVAAPRPARADAAEEARLHFELGLRASNAHDYRGAVEHFVAAYRLAPTTLTAFNLAFTYDTLERGPRLAAPERAGYASSAYEYYHLVLQRPDLEARYRDHANGALSRLGPSVARVQVETEPPGASIFVDRTELGAFGSAPRLLAVTPGAHRLVLRLQGYREREAPCVATLGATTVVRLTLERTQGTVQLRSSPAGAQVLLDGEDSGQRTPAVLTLAPGEHRVRLRLAGYLELERVVRVEPDARVALDEPLALDLAHSAVLSVRSAQPGAEVRVRGVLLGRTPFSAVLTELGASPLSVSRAGSNPVSRTLLLRPGRETSVTVALGAAGARRPVWIFLLGGAGLAGIAAGAGVGGGALAARGSFFSQPSRDGLDAVQRLNVAADVTMGVGLAMLVAGTVAFLLTPDPSISRATVREEGLRDATP